MAIEESASSKIQETETTPCLNKDFTREVEDQQHDLRVADVIRDQGAETFLTCRVPQLEPQNLVATWVAFRNKIDSDRRVRLLVENIENESVYYRRLSDALVSQ